MSSKLRFFLFAALLLISNGLRADIADGNDEQRIYVHVELMNGNKFPGYQFFVQYQTYEGYGGYDPDSLVELPLTPGISQATSEYNDMSFIFARDSAGNLFQSTFKFGGSSMESAPDYAYLVQRIEVVSIRNGEIEVKLVATMKMVDYEEVIEMKKGAVGAQSQEIIRFALLPAVCLLGLIAFFVVRRRQIARG
ncbi:MAG: hypothetical protein RLZZ519_2737 [Bacteroidota bacterium]